VRIALVTPEYAGITPASGGLGTQFQALAQELHRRGHDVHVVAPAGDAPPAGGPPVHVFPSTGGRVLHRLRDAVAADRHIGAVDAVFAPEWAGTAWRYARRRRRAPLVTNLTTSSVQILAMTSGVPRRAQVDPRVFVPRLLERDQARRSDHLAACSRAMLDWARELWPIDSVPQSVLPNAVDLTAVRGHATGSQPPEIAAGDGPVIAVPGRLEPRKGSHVLAAALPLVADRVPDVRLVLLGKDGRWEEGPMSERMRELAGDHAGRMAFLGHQPPERLFPALAHADVLAMPSLWEAFGLTALEGMALGRPVVVTSGSGFDDFCRDGDNCLAVPPGDAPALAAALVRLLTDRPLAERLGGAARAAADGYGIESMADGLLELFERLRARNSRESATPRSL
jgi:glycosyltransferase involved in cell wall biosynthesis